MRQTVAQLNYVWITLFSN